MIGTTEAIIGVHDGRKMESAYCDFGNGGTNFRRNSGASLRKDDEYWC
jgi:hypothetical protein